MEETNNKQLIYKNIISWKHEKFGIFVCFNCDKTIYIHVKSITLLESKCPYCYPYKQFIPVLLESPYAGKTQQEIDKNIQYARACMKDCLDRGEAPFASHLLYTQPGILNDSIPEERIKGIEAGLLWGKFAKKTVVYCDYGITEGMMKGIKRAENRGRIIEKRLLSRSGNIGYS